MYIEICGDGQSASCFCWRGSVTTGRRTPLSIPSRRRLAINRHAVVGSFFVVLCTTCRRRRYTVLSAGSTCTFVSRPEARRRWSRTATSCTVGSFAARACALMCPAAHLARRAHVLFGEGCRRSSLGRRTLISTDMLQLGVHAYALHPRRHPFEDLLAWWARVCWKRECRSWRLGRGERSNL